MLLIYAINIFYLIDNRLCTIIPYEILFYCNRKIGYVDGIVYLSVQTLSPISQCIIILIFSFVSTITFIFIMCNSKILH